LCRLALRIILSIITVVCHIGSGGWHIDRRLVTIVDSYYCELDFHQKKLSVKLDCWPLPSRKGFDCLFKQCYTTAIATHFAVIANNSNNNYDRQQMKKMTQQTTAC
jgi:hypothetical protein